MPASLDLKLRSVWPLALSGLGLAVFAVVALSGPGRIDIVDGQTRFEVGQSLADHGDSVIRDPRIWWGRFPGRDGQDYAYYRFPHSLLGAGMTLLADVSGPVSEGRRHFFFSLIGSVCCGLLSILYAIYFRHVDCRPGRALAWAAGGVFCTPMWFYGTSTFDEFLGTTVIVAALVTAFVGKHCSVLYSISAGLLLGLAFNCKQPLAAFGLLAIVLHDDRTRSIRERFLRASFVTLGLSLGIAAEQGYDRYKFPFDKGQAHAELLKLYGPNFADHQLAAAAGLSVSPGAGAIWYFPPVILAIVGLFVQGRRLVIAFVLSSIIFLAFFLSLSYFKGDPCWGPRYLTPLFGVLWLFVPAGFVRARPLVGGSLLFLGLIVQVLALTVDPHRLYVEKDASSGFARVEPWLYFHPVVSHLWNRPREIIEIARTPQPAAEFTPAPAPTFAFPLLDPPYLKERGRAVVQRYQVLSAYRPWWISMTGLPAEDRPVNLGKTAAVLLAVLGVGFVLIGLSLRLLNFGVRSEST